MRLLVISQYFWPEEFRINDLVSELVARGHEVTVLTGQPNYPSGKIFPEFLADPDRFSSFRGARIVRAPLLPRRQGDVNLLLNYISFAVSATFVGIRALRGRTFEAILVFQASPVTVGLPAIALRRLKRIPIAFWVQDHWPETLAAVGVVRSKALLNAVGRLVSFIYGRCDLILAQSRSMVSQVQRYAPARVRIAYFPNWAESVYSTRAAAPAPEVPPREGSFNVMFAGNIGESQNFPMVLDAAEQLRSEEHIRWLIIGDGRLAEWVRKEVTRRGLERTVLLLGRYPHDRMPSFFEHASALLVSLKPDPIFSATIPSKVQSYMAFGLPVVGALDGEGARLINESGAGFACPAGDANGLAEIVRRLTRMTEAERRALGENGQAFVRKEFDRDTLVRQLEQWLTELSGSL